VYELIVADQLHCFACKSLWILASLLPLVFFRELLFILVYTIMMATSTCNSQAAAFDANVSVAETTQPHSNDANVPQSTTQTLVVPSTSEAQSTD